MIAHNITDVCGPRLTNSPGYNHALDWVTEICKKWGCKMPVAKPGAGLEKDGMVIL